MEKNEYERQRRLNGWGLRLFPPHLLFEGQIQIQKTAIDMIGTLMVNPLPANHDNCRFQFILLADYFTVIGNEMSVQTLKFVNVGLKLNKYE